MRNTGAVKVPSVEAGKEKEKLMLKQAREAGKALSENIRREKMLGNK